MCIMVQPLTLALPKCVHLLYLRHVCLIPKMYGLLQLIIIHNCAVSIDSCCSPINTFYSFISFSLLINAVILLLSCFNTFTSIFFLLDIILAT